MTITEMLASLTLVALGAGAAIPSVTTMLHAAKLNGAARDLVVLMHRARMEAVSRGCHVGLLFETTPTGGRWRLYRDGGSPGIHTAEIASGIDEPIGSPFELSARYPGVRLGITGPAPRIPPSSGTLSSSDDPIAFGVSDIYSASPTGETTSGTVYLTDGRDMRAVTAYGATGRLRVRRYDASNGTWRS